MRTVQQVPPNTCSSLYANNCTASLLWKRRQFTNRLLANTSNSLSPKEDKLVSPILLISLKNLHPEGISQLNSTSLDYLFAKYSFLSLLLILNELWSVLLSSPKWNNEMVTTTCLLSVLHNLWWLTSLLVSPPNIIVEISPSQPCSLDKFVIDSKLE